MSRPDGVRRRTPAVTLANNQNNAETDECRDEDKKDDIDDKETRMTLMEEVLLLGLKEKEVGLRNGFEILCSN